MTSDEEEEGVARSVNVLAYVGLVVLCGRGAHGCRKRSSWKVVVVYEVSIYQEQGCGGGGAESGG